MPIIKTKEREQAAEMLRKGIRSKEIADKLGVSQVFVIDVKKRIGLHKPKQPREMLTLECEQCGKAIKRAKTDQEFRQRQAERRGAARAGVFCCRKCFLKSSQWTAKDEKFLRDNFGTMPNIVIGRVLGRAGCTVGEKARTMGLKYFDTYTQEELDRIRELHGTMDYRAIASIVGRKSRNAIRGAIVKLGLSNPKEYVTECKWCGCRRNQSSGGIFKRGMCHACYDLLHRFNFDEELAEAYELAAQLGFLSGNKVAGRQRRRKQDGR